MKKLLLILLLLLGIAGFLICAAMFVMAIRYGELGRVVFYGLLAVVSAELAFVSFPRLR